ncbi:hypothetical protein Q5H93_21850 [Hymenobacter sp. ASUV-10]|uniref:Uncharacterized protein n=1 Tax=Hymenobacter aranciens TaxID=3063996 RepID=A0ABT9BGK9_9BACT|nr:hypothetical protein [Hymenobacter sp. ASUV-10]MDO7877400.1 hypothetical protein [Hymenobacter sp. ASUV-10]
MSEQPEQKPAVPRPARRNRARVEKRALTEKQLRKKPEVQAFLDQFYANGENFLHNYLNWRDGLLNEGVATWQQQQAAEAQLARTAVQRLWQIQQRKLFVQQCQWRADALDLRAEGIETAADFGSWGHRIHECAWLPPITKAEVEEYLAYLETEDCEDLNPHIPYQIDHWQFHEPFWLNVYGRLDHGDLAYLTAARSLAEDGHLNTLHSLQESYNWNTPYPLWYNWCDEYHQPPLPVINLPNLRGVREYRYLTAALQQQQLSEPPAAPTAAPPDTPAPAAVAPAPPAPAELLPLDPDNWNVIYTLLEEENLQTQQHFRVVWPVKFRIMSFGWDPEEFLETRGEQLEKELLTLTERLPLAPHADYRQALYLTWLGHYRRRLQAAIRHEFAAYQQRRAAGQPHPDPYPDPAPKAAHAALRAEYNALILAGRALAGEPQTFDF